MYKFVQLSIILLFTILHLSSCSTKKNTAASRGYHQMTTMYNIYFNANQSYIDGIQSINKGNIDDFSRVLPMYAISNPENKNKATAQMDKTIEKCRKSIKKHSITRKPERNSRKWSDPKYQAFYRQNEFVPGVKKSWITLGQAELHKGDFIGAIGTFSYIIRHYPNDVNIVTEARIWLTRAYAEMNWMNEAEEAFLKIKANDVHRTLTGIYSATKADMLMKQQKYSEAYPYLNVAVKNEKNKTQRTRFYYILGQIALENNNTNDAFNWFSKVKKSSPPYLMDFNARLNIFSSLSETPQKATKGLLKMAKHPNNLEYLDQIYHSLGNIYLANRDTLKAIEYYKTGANESVRKGKDKAALLITTGDLYLQRKEYVNAFPCFQEASSILDNTHPDYSRIEKYGSILGEVAVNYEMVVLQDSLQHLSTLNTDEQLKIINKVIEQVKEEKEEANKLAKETEDKANLLARRATNTNSMTPIGGMGGSQDWYFYNDNLKQSGFAQFKQKWGSRKSEDNWRRINKSSFATDNENNVSSNDSTSNTSTPENAIPDSTKYTDPEYYLAQIPKTKDDINASNKLIATALYNLGDIYSSKLEDYNSALDVYQDFIRRFGNDSLVIEILYCCYRIAGKMGDTSEQEYYSSEIIRKFPKSTYAMMLSQPDYIDRMKAMFSQQDSIYKKTYTAYTNNEFTTVKNNFVYMQKNYPLSELLPKFALLNALSIGRTDKDTSLITALSNIISLYPDSDVTPMCKDILALMKQGKEAQQGTVGNIANKRQEVVENEALETSEPLAFVFEDKVPHELYIIPHNYNNESINTLLYNIALFNFTKFLVKEYDIRKDNIDGLRSIKIEGFSNKEEALWYETMLLADPLLQGLITLDVCQRIIISTDNATKITQGLNLDEYKKQSTSKK